MTLVKKLRTRLGKSARREPTAVRRSLIGSVLGLLVAGVLGACGGNGSSQEEVPIDQNPRQGQLGFVNAISGSSIIDFGHFGTNAGLTSGSLGFGQGTGRAPFLVGIYSIRMTYRNAADETIALIIRDNDVELFEDDERTFIAAGTLATPTIIEVANPEFLFGLSPAQRLALQQDPELQFVHAASGAGTLDFYLLGDGETTVDRAAFATLTFAQQSTLQMAEPAAATRVVVTPNGDPATILFDSGATAFGLTTRTLMVATDYAGPGAQTLTLERFTSVQEGFPNIDLPGGLRVVNLVADSTGFDAYLGEVTGDTLATDLNFLEATDFLERSAGDTALSVTPTGVDDEFVTQVDFSLLAGQFQSLFLLGNLVDPATMMAGEVQTFVTVDQRRALAEGVAFVQVLQASPSSGPVRVYILAPDRTVDDTATTLSGVFGSNVPTFLPPGDYRVLVTDTSNVTLAGPVALTIAPNATPVIAVTDTDGGGLPPAIRILTSAAAVEE